MALVALHRKCLKLLYKDYIAHCRTRFTPRGKYPTAGTSLPSIAPAVPSARVKASRDSDTVFKRASCQPVAPAGSSISAPRASQTDCGTLRRIAPRHPCGGHMPRCYHAKPVRQFPAGADLKLFVPASRPPIESLTAVGFSQLTAHRLSKDFC